MSMNTNIPSNISTRTLPSNNINRGVTTEKKKDCQCEDDDIEHTLDNFKSNFAGQLQQSEDRRRKLIMNNNITSIEKKWIPYTTYLKI